MADKPMLLREIIHHDSPGGDSVMQKINLAIPDASTIVSVVHERDELGHLNVYVYYRA
jgi:hypothetical protein